MSVIKKETLLVIFLLSFVCSSFSSYAAESLAPSLPDIAKQHKSSINSGAEIIKKRVEITLDKSLRSESVVYLAIQVNDAEAVRDYSQIKISFNSHYDSLSLDFANVLNKKGEIVSLSGDAVQLQTPSENAFYQDKQHLVFSLPSIQPGTVLEYQYRIKNIKPVIKDSWFNRLSLYHFEGKSADAGVRADPVVDYLATLSAPSDVEFSISTPKAAKFSRNIKGDRQTLSWSAKNLPLFPLENGMPVYLGLGQRIDISTVKDWSEIATWADALFAPRIETALSLKLVAEKLSKNVENREQAIKAVYGFIQENVRYVFAHVGRGGYEPHSASEVLANGYGDCKDQAVLTVSLLRLLGVDAYPALVTTKHAGAINVDVVGINFDHAITYIPAADGKSSMWLDTTGDHNLYPGVTWGTEGQPALVINKQTNTIRYLPSYDESYHNVTLELTLEPNQRNEVIARFEMHFSGMFEQRFRSWWGYSREPEKELRSLVEQIYNSAEVVSVSAKNERDIWKPFVIEGELKLLGDWKGEPDPVAMPVGVSQLLRLFSGLGDYDRPEEREQPFEMDTSYKLSLKAHMIKPREGYTAVTVTVGPEESTEYYQLIQHGEQTTQGYDVAIDFILKKNTVVREKYQEFYQQLTHLDSLPHWMISFQFNKKAAALAELTSMNKERTEAESQLALSQFYIDHGEFDKAMIAARTAVEFDGANGKAYFLLGMAQGYNGLFDASDKSFSRAKELGYK